MTESEITNNTKQSKKKLKKNNNILALLIIIIAVLLVFGGIVAFFALRPDLKSLKVSSISYEEDYTFVNVNIVSNRDDIEIYVKDFSIFSDNSPISADAIYYDQYYYEYFCFNQDKYHTNEIIIEIRFELSKSEIDTPIKIAYKGTLIK